METPNILNNFQKYYGFAITKPTTITITTGSDVSTIPAAAADILHRKILIITAQHQENDQTILRFQAKWIPHWAPPDTRNPTTPHWNWSKLRSFFRRINNNIVWNVLGRGESFLKANKIKIIHETNYHHFGSVCFYTNCVLCLNAIA